MTPENTKTIKQDLDSIFSNEEWSKYIAKGYMVPGNQLKNTGVTEVINNINLMK
jgi:hypothetical protein